MVVEYCGHVMEVHITVCMALLVFVLCQPVHSCIEPSLHGLDFFLEIFLWRFVISSLVVAGFCPAVLWKDFQRLMIPYNDSVGIQKHRTGTLCGSCMANQSVVWTNSEELKCVSDSECHFWSWLMYIASYFSTTLMLIIVVIFQPQLYSLSKV